MDWNTDLYSRCARLRRTSAALGVDVSALRAECARIRTHLDRPATGGAVYDAPDDPHDIALEALRLIRTIIDPFPIEWQVSIVKALTARTILKAHEQTQPPATTTLSA